MKYNTELWVAKAKEKYDDEYDYSKVKYVNAKREVLVTHNKCGNTFAVLPPNHLKGSKCPNKSCRTPPRQKKSNEALTLDSFIQKAQSIYGSEEYDYTKLTEFKSENEVVLLYHTKCCREFEETPVDHLKGEGCPFEDCDKVTLEHQCIDFVETAKSIYGTEYDYRSVTNRTFLSLTEPVIIKHNECGQEVEVIPEEHIRGNSVCGQQRCLEKRVENEYQTLDTDDTPSEVDTSKEKRVARKKKKENVSQIPIFTSTGITECTVGKKNSAQFQNIHTAMQAGFTRFRISSNTEERKSLPFSSNGSYFIYIDSGVTYTMCSRTPNDLKSSSLTIMGTNSSSVLCFESSTLGNSILTNVSVLSIRDITIRNGTVADRPNSTFSPLQGHIECMNVRFECSNSSYCLFGDVPNSKCSALFQNCYFIGSGERCNNILVSPNSSGTTIRLYQCILEGTFSPESSKKDVISFKTTSNFIDGLLCHTTNQVSITVCGTVKGCNGEHLTLRVCRSNTSVSECNVGGITTFPYSGSNIKASSLFSVNVSNSSFDTVEFDPSLPLKHCTFDNIAIHRTPILTILGWSDCIISSLRLLSSGAVLRVTSDEKFESTSLEICNVTCPSIEIGCSGKASLVRHVRLHNLSLSTSFKIYDNSERCTIDRLSTGDDFVSFHIEGRKHSLSQIEIESGSVIFKCDYSNISNIQCGNIVTSFILGGTSNLLHYCLARGNEHGESQKLLIEGSDHTIDTLYVGDCNIGYGGFINKGGEIHISANRCKLHNLNIRTARDGKDNFVLFRLSGNDCVLRQCTFHRDKDHHKRQYEVPILGSRCLLWSCHTDSYFDYVGENIIERDCITGCPRN